MMSIPEISALGSFPLCCIVSPNAERFFITSIYYIRTTIYDLSVFVVVYPYNTLTGSYFVPWKAG